jgi:hypothetical protein
MGAQAGANATAKDGARRNMHGVRDLSVVPTIAPVLIMQFSPMTAPAFTTAPGITTVPGPILAELEMIALQ